MEPVTLAMIGPETAALVVVLHNGMGVPLAHVVTLLRDRFGLRVTRGALVHVCARTAARDPDLRGTVCPGPRQSGRESRRNRLERESMAKAGQDIDAQTRRGRSMELNINLTSTSASRCRSTRTVKFGDFFLPPNVVVIELGTSTGVPAKKCLDFHKERRDIRYVSLDKVTTCSRWSVSAGRSEGRVRQ